MWVAWAWFGTLGKFDIYMNLCELEKHLKAGGPLRCSVGK